MMMDGSLYEEPKLFKPERFFENGATSRAQRSGYTEYDPESKVFGFGRRLDSAFSIPLELLTFQSLGSVQDDSTLTRAFG